MSIIFPTEPAKTHIHLLPSNADFISYRVKHGFLMLKAWMPSGLASFNNSYTKEEKDNIFYEDNCENCRRNCYSYFSDYMDEYDDVNWDEVQANNECLVYNDGYHGEHCPEGHLVPDYNTDGIEISNIVVEVAINYTKRFHLNSDYDNAHLSAGILTATNQIKHTPQFKAANVFEGNNDLYDINYTGHICWGDNDQPDNLREAVNTYLFSDFNNDLLSLNAFKENIESQNNHRLNNDFNFSSIDTFLCSGYDALMLIHVERDTQAFYTMLIAGFEPLDKPSCIMAIPLEQATIKRGEDVYFGYTTPTDDVGRKWYVTPDGLIIGQLDESFVYSKVIR